MKLSDGASTLPTVFHPWEMLRRLPHITFLKEAEQGLLGSWCEGGQEVRLHPLLTQRERRCTLTHELIHAERGDTTCAPSVHREAARRLISIEALAKAALVYADDLEHLADELWVDLDTLKTRLLHLHPAEVGYLKRALAMKEQSA